MCGNRWYQTYTTYVGDREDITQENGILCYTDGSGRRSPNLPQQQLAALLRGQRKKGFKCGQMAAKTISMASLCQQKIRDQNGITKPKNHCEGTISIL
jgi:hypothetical protein